MNRSTPDEVEQHVPDTSDSIAFDSFARISTRRHVVPPLILSVAVAAAVLASILQLAVRLNEETAVGLRTLIDRFLGNDFSLAIVVVFLTSAVYGALQLAGIVVDRQRVRLLGSTASEDRVSWLAFMSGRQPRARAGAPAMWAAPILGDLREAADRYRFHLDHHSDQGLLPLRFSVWVLPLLGFIGTVVGIARSITGLKTVITPGAGAQSAEGLSIVLGGLQFAFDTTLLGLVAVIPVMLLQMVLRGRESELAEEARHRVLTLLTLAGIRGAPLATSPNGEAG